MGLPWGLDRRCWGRNGRLLVFTKLPLYLDLVVPGHPCGPRACPDLSVTSVSCTAFNLQTSRLRVRRSGKSGLP